MTLAWTTALTVGLAEIDRDHQEFLRRTNDFVEAMRGASGSTRMAPLLGYLDDFARRHHDTEERLMRAHGYPGLSAHQAEHARFRQDLREGLAEQARTGSSAFLTLQLAVALERGLRDHTCGSDLAFADFLRATPPPAPR